MYLHFNKCVIKCSHTKDKPIKINYTKDKGSRKAVFIFKLSFNGVNRFYFA